MNSENPNENISSQYIPGTCNLGKKEIERRMFQLLVGVLLTVIAILILQMNQSSPKYRLIIFMPLAYSALSYLQAKNKFCVLFGYRGFYNFSDDRNHLGKVPEEFKKKDRMKSVVIFSQAIIIAIILTTIYYYLPV